MSDNSNILKEFLTGGWIVSIIGGIGMAARLLIEGKEMTIKDYTKKILSAILCSTIAWFMLEQIEASSFVKAIGYGIVGVVSPEIMGGIILLAKRFAKKPQDYIK